MRTDDPEPHQVARAASDCLVVPREVGDREDNPPMPPDFYTPPTESDRAWREPYERIADRDRSAIDEQRWGRGAADPDAKDWPAPLNTVSPLRDFADNAGRRFQQVLAVARTSFPGLPEPSWLWS